MMTNGNSKSPLRIPVGPNQTQVIVPLINMQNSNLKFQMHSDLNSASAERSTDAQGLVSDQVVLVQSAQTTERMEDKKDVSSRAEIVQT